MITVAIIDVIGLTYDGTTLQKRGLGGSESAVILMAKELRSLGLDVTVFNNCIDREASPGIYDGVKYIDLTQIQSLEDPHFDVVLASRTIVPFLPPDVQTWHRSTGAPLHEYHKIRKHAKLKAVWMHDTFCDGDHLVEDLVVHGFIDELFTLSDFHTSYVTNCDHGRKRMFEVLKNKIFMTRNGVVNYHDEVDIAAKDPDLFVYNASVTKGMIPLVEKIWPAIKERIPQAELKVIGGYYRFRENAEPDEQEKTWRIKANDPTNPIKGIEYTGIIKQSEIANILAKSSYMIYPGAFPETFGISSLESLTYNTPLITTRFGALEETAVNQACYMIDYPIVPNGLFPLVNEEQQVNRFIDLTLRAYSDKYLHQQKMYMCSIVKDICTWDTVALQWKHHFYKKLGIYLSKDEYRRVSRINSRVREVFGRRFTNPEEGYIPRKAEQRIVVVTPTYNAENYIEKCIQSVTSQDYDNWHMYIIDDCSTDNTVQVINRAIEGITNVTLICNETNKGAPYNHVNTIKQYCNVDDIIMLIDGDDALVSNNQIFQYYNNLYDGTTEFSYGSCWSMIDNIPLIAQHYPKHVKENRSYRNHRFNWNMPYTHLRTFKAGLLLSLDDSNFKDDTGNWYKAGGDGAVFYSVLEQADPSKVKVVQDVVYLYNDANPINDYKVNSDEQTRNANKILQSKVEHKDKFSVVVPTMWRYEGFVPFLSKLLNCTNVEEVIVIDNDTNSRPTLPTNSKLRVFEFGTNIFVNPAWNFGIKESRCNKVLIVNDDIEFDTAVFDAVSEYVTPDNGLIGLCPGEPDFNQYQITDGNIKIIKWQGEHTYGFGCMFFVDKRNWVDIPSDLKIYYGDNFTFDLMIAANKPNYLITNMKFGGKFAQTTSDTSITEGVLQRESVVYEQIKSHLPTLAKKDKFSVIIPTMWRAFEYLDLYDHLVNCDLVGEVIIINNDVSKTPLWLPTLSHPKIVMINQETNIMVNPAWNLGAEVAKYDRLCFCNDDIVFDTKLFEKIYDRVTPEYGPHGIIWGREDMGQPPTTDGSIEFMQWRPGFVAHCFGQLFFQHRSNWVPIASELKMYFGDDWIFHNAILTNKVPWLIYNIFFKSQGTMTASHSDLKSLSKERYEIEHPIYSEWQGKHPATI